MTYSTNGYNNPLTIIDTVTQERLKLQWVPKEIKYKPESTFVNIASPGRNNPFYHFGGSEDSIVLELDWHATDEDRVEAINNCRWLEALTKNDGWDNAPHPVLLDWGNTQFLNAGSDEAWLVVDAPYELSQFNRPKGMLPVQAYQTITLKRITDSNRARATIRFGANIITQLNGDENPDDLAYEFQKSLSYPYKLVTEEQNKLKDGTLTPFDNNRYKNPKRNWPLERGFEIAQSAAQYFANQKVFGLTQEAAKKVGGIKEAAFRIPQL